MDASRPGEKMLILQIFIIYLILQLLSSVAFADSLSHGLSACAKIEKAEERLACYDRLAGRQARPADTIVEAAPSETQARPVELSVMEKQWDLNPNNRRHSFVMRPYRMNYFLPVAYNSSPNEDTNLEYDPQAHVQFNEAKFQLSLKAKVWEDLWQKPLQRVYDKAGVVKGVDVWVGYTQLSFWQIYNSAFSAPFRDTNYEPELLFNFRSQYEIPGLAGTKLQYFNIGFNHQSNGRSRPLSRSWNRLVGNVGLERGGLNLELKTWYRIPDDESHDDNPDIIRYMGYGELRATYYQDKQRFAVMFRNNLRRENLGAVQLDWSIPPATLGRMLQRHGLLSEDTVHNWFTDKFSLYLQYFNGYGEGLMDYNTSINRISAGIMIADWN